MTRILILLFCLLLSGTINGHLFPILKSFNEYTPPLSQLEKDAAELTLLLEEFWSLKPATVLEEGPLVLCRIFDECCEEKERSRAISTFISFMTGGSTTDLTLEKVIENCVDLTDLKESIPTCPLIRNALYPVRPTQLISNAEEYGKLWFNFAGKVDILNNVTFATCDNEEWHAALCLTNTTLVKNCVTKLFQAIQRISSLRIYQNFVKETKEQLLKINRRLVYSELKNTQKLIQPFLQVLSKYNSKKMASA